MKNDFLRVCVVLLLGAAVAACGGSSEESAGDSGAVSEANNITAPPVESPFNQPLEDAGFVAVDFRRFPSQTPGMKANATCYRAKSGKAGGVLYTQQFGSEEQVAWHWHFDSGSPDSIVPVELNDDGLWDVRMYMRDGKTVDYLQEESFTFVGRLRDDVIAHNGEASDPADPKGAVWHCFDGDSTSAWRASVGRGGAFIDMPIPLGVEAGVLTVQLAPTDQPATCEIKADGKTVQEIELRQTTSAQVFQLDAKAHEADVVRLVVKSVHGGGNTAAIAELGLR